MDIGNDYMQTLGRLGIDSKNMVNRRPYVIRFVAPYTNKHYFDIVRFAKYPGKYELLTNFWTWRLVTPKVVHKLFPKTLLLFSCISTFVYMIYRKCKNEDITHSVNREYYEQGEREGIRKMEGECRSRYIEGEMRGKKDLEKIITDDKISIDVIKKYLPIILCLEKEKKRKNEEMIIRDFKRKINTEEYKEQVMH